MKEKYLKRKQKFESLTPEERRVVVAKDVIKTIEKGKFIAGGGYLMPLSKPGEPFQSDDDIQSNLDKVDKCVGCALGACILSLTKYKNILNFEDVSKELNGFNQDKLKQLLSETFDRWTLQMIEDLYEGIRPSQTRVASILPREGDRNYAYDWRTKCQIDHFSNSFVSKDKKIIAIMENIIKNKGNLNLKELIAN